MNDQGDRPAPPPPLAPATRPWRVRTPDGRIRALGVEHLQIMLNAGLLTQDTCITDRHSEDWQPVVAHEVWQQLHPPKPPTSGAEMPGRTTLDEEAKPGSLRISRHVTPEMENRMLRVHKRETDRLSRALWLHRAARWSAWARDLCLFLLFLCLGDLMGEFIGREAGVTKLAAMLSVLTLGTGYIALRTFRF